MNLLLNETRNMYGESQLNSFSDFNNVKIGICSKFIS